MKIKIYEMQDKYLCTKNCKESENYIILEDTQLNLK